MTPADSDTAARARASGGDLTDELAGAELWSAALRANVRNGVTSGYSAESMAEMADVLDALHDGFYRVEAERDAAVARADEAIEAIEAIEAHRAANTSNCNNLSCEKGCGHDLRLYAALDSDEYRRTDR